MLSSADSKEKKKCLDFLRHISLDCTHYEVEMAEAWIRVKLPNGEDILPCATRAMHCLDVVLEKT